MQPLPLLGPAGITSAALIEWVPLSGKHWRLAQGYRGGSDRDLALGDLGIQGPRSKKLPSPQSYELEGGKR